MKKRFTNLFSAAFLFLLLSSCASTTGTTARTGGDDKDKSTGANESSKKESEDLSKYRPKFTLPKASTPVPATGENPFMPLPGTTPIHHVNERIAGLLDTMATMNRSVRFAKGYRILVYSGMERKTAMDIRNTIVSRLPDDRVYPQYKQPTWRVKVGDYFNRLEANQALARIKDIAPKATIVEDQINVK